MMLNRVSLNTIGLNRIGLNRIGKPSRGSSDRPYIDPEVLASLKAVCICYGKSNDDPDRAIVKNLVDPDNPFVISNAAYTEGSGYADKGSPYYGAFVTDGIDDTIISTKTLAEMGITDEVTVVSMIHQISLNPTYNNGFTNYIENLDKSTYVRNNIYKAGKTGIYGYSASLTSRTYSDINNILGDKKDYGTEIVNRQNTLDRTKFSVVGRASNISEVSSIAWYWNFISNKYLTTDQINQVIAYFNLDRTLNPDILCNTIKQGITNENHAEFGDKLIDFSGNGRDIQLNNIAWKGDSGIGKYNFSNINIIASNRFEGTVTTNKCHFTKKLTDTTNNFCDLLVISPNEPIKFKVSGLSDGRKLFVANKSGSGSNYNFDNGEHEVSLSFSEGVGQNNPFGVTGDIGDIDVTVEFIPSHEGALCLDGVNDFGKVTGMPIYKDYTFIAEREFLSTPDGDNITNGSLVSKADGTGKGAFIIEEITKQRARESSFSIGTNIVDYNTDRSISYQSKYSYNGKALTAGQVEDRDVMWLGTIRDNDTRFVNAAIYSLMSFPYSMSEFLIERQLKKHKLGTLYPDMVEFRPIIKQDDRIKSIKYYIDGQTANIGQYYPIGTGLGIAVETVQPYMVKSLKVNGVNTIPNADYKGFNHTLDSKSPQKITMDIQVNSSLVQWNPVVESNVPYKSLRYYNNLQGTGWEQFEVGEYLPIGSVVLTRVNLNNPIDELSGATSSQLKNIQIGRNGVAEYDISGALTSESPQKINITIDEYIRYEDIVQPYPVLLRFNDENGNEVSWGGKFRVGSTITRIGSFYENNLIDGLYIVRNPKLNGNNLITPTHVVEKSMVFTCDTEYLLDNNEPKCILSPSRLRIPNSSYKILGYIPDISGHGNHGVIHNSAYAGASGANGYLQNFSGWTKASGVSSTDSVISSSNNLVAANGWIAYVTSGNVIPTFKVEISGIPVNGNLRFEGSDQVLVNGVNTIQGLTTTKVSGFYISNGYDNDWSNLRIEQIGEYEGAYCLDGVDDFVTIPTLSSGGKQVLMKVNWSNNTFNEILYDQRENLDIHTFAIFNHDSDTVTGESVVAYNSKNNGNTYIDGILNYNIKASELKDIEHNITITNESVNTNNSISPTIGTNKNKDAHYAQMALYDFMLFDNISTDDKIKELNEYVGIEAKVELPPYYWDAYGKTNLDKDKATIQQRGVAVGDYDLTNYNHAYDKMSGYGGYNLSRFDKSWSSSSNTSIKVVQRNPYDITLKKLGGNSDWEFNNTELKVISNPVSVKFKSNKNIRVTCDYHYYPVGGNSEGTPLGITSKDLIANKDAIITISPISQENIDKYNIDVNRGYYLIYFQLSSTLAVNEEVIIEMLPLYPNGLVYDGVTDYSENANIPALTDYTYIFKRELLDASANTCSMCKGILTEGSRTAFVSDYDKNTEIGGRSFGNYIAVSSLRTNKIIYGTKASVNGVNIVPGNNVDALGLVLGKYYDSSYKKLVFYKLILYPKTIPLLQINFLKNLMERDEIIDLNNPIFIQE